MGEQNLCHLYLFTMKTMEFAIEMERKHEKYVANMESIPMQAMHYNKWSQELIYGTRRERKKYSENCSKQGGPSSEFF